MARYAKREEWLDTQKMEITKSEKRKRVSYDLIVKLVNGFIEFPS